MLPTPVFWPREFHGPCSPWGHKESDTTERLSLFMHRKKKKDHIKIQTLSLSCGIIFDWKDCFSLFSSYPN